MLAAELLSFLAAAAILAMMVAVTISVRFVLRRRASTSCSKCGYARSAEIIRCPECGLSVHDQCVVLSRRVRIWTIGVLVTGIGVALAGFLSLRGQLLREVGVTALLPTCVVRAAAMAEIRDFIMNTGDDPMDRPIVRDLMRRIDIGWASSSTLKDVVIDLVAVGAKPDCNPARLTVAAEWVVARALSTGTIDISALRPLLEAGMVRSRREWPRATVPSVEVYFLSLLQAPGQSRELTLQLMGTSRVDHVLPIPSSVSGRPPVCRVLMAPWPRDNETLRFDVVVEEIGSTATGGARGTVLRFSGELPIVGATDVASAQFAPRRGVLSLASDWQDQVRVHGIPAGSRFWFPQGLIVQAMPDAVAHDTSVCVLVELQCDGKTVASARLCLPAEGNTRAREWQVPWEGSARNTPPRVDLQQCELSLHITPDPDMALRISSTTSYWDGDVRIPVTSLVDLRSYGAIAPLALVREGP